MRPILLALALATLAAAQESYPFRTYVADIDAYSVTLAWGRANGTTRNTIGKGAPSDATAEIRIDGRTVPAKGSWAQVTGLKPDTPYPYTVRVAGEGEISGVVRTWPAKSNSLTFFVIGDFGTGEKVQYRLAARMEEERQRLENSGRPVRFVMSVGDNIYGKYSASGAQDRDWEKKYFAPYEKTLRAIPFKAVLGNHDGNQSERGGDLEACLDNFFMPYRWYRFEYAAFVEFLALDTTTNQPSGRPAPVYLSDTEQTRWLDTQLARPPLPWRLINMHNPLFTAGPNHDPFLPKAPHFLEAFRKSGVQAVFSGHEHNLQFSHRNQATGNIQFIISGAGGELRPSTVRKKMDDRQIAAWSNQNHFLVVTITGKQMAIDPVGIEPISLLDSAGKPATIPVRIQSNR